jgi:hypothetical protein
MYGAERPQLVQCIKAAVQTRIACNMGGQCAIQKVKVKVKFTPEQATKAQRGSRGRALLFLTSALDGVGGKRHAPAALSPGNTQYTLYRRLGRSQGQSGREISPPPGFDPRTVQPVASRYTD